MEKVIYCVFDALRKCPIFCVKVLYVYILKYSLMNELAITIHDCQRLNLMHLYRKISLLWHPINQNV